MVPVCGPGSRVIAKFLDFTQIEDFREKLFIANFFRVFVKTPHGQIFDLSILENKKCGIDIARTRVSYCTFKTYVNVCYHFLTDWWLAHSIQNWKKI